MVSHLHPFFDQARNEKPNLMQTTILIIEDEQPNARMTQMALNGFGYHSVVVNNGLEGIQYARRNPPDLILLDVNMPNMNGYEVCDEVRRDPLLNKVPIIMLTARGNFDDKISGFHVGADDYVTKPYRKEELNVRIQAVLRRSSPDFQVATSNMSKIITVGDIQLDCQKYEISAPHGTAMLTNVQFDLLYHLMANAGKIFSSQQLLQDVWGYPPHEGSPELVRAHIRNLREKVEPEPSKPQYVKTVQGHGYSFVDLV